MGVLRFLKGRRYWQGFLALGNYNGLVGGTELSSPAYGECLEESLEPLGNKVRKGLKEAKPDSQQNEKINEG
jgi:hypothetical protein